MNDSVFCLEEMLMSAEYNEVHTETEYREFDLVIRSEIIINASAQIVWGQLQRLEQWKDSIQSLEHIAGMPGQVGDVVRIGQRRGQNVVYVTQEALAIQPGRWKVEYLQTLDRQAARGYIVYSLYPMASGTLVACDLLLRTALPSAQVDGSDPELTFNTARVATQEKLDADHAVLKKLSEQR